MSFMTMQAQLKNQQIKISYLMTIRNLFSEQGRNETIARIEKLTPDSKAQWGKMTVDQMLAHSNVTFRMTYTDKYPPLGGFTKLMLKLFVKKGVVSTKPYPKNGRTAPDFIVTGKKDFEVEKNMLISYIMKTGKLGASHFEQKPYRSFGKLSAEEWNNMFSKHLDHHLTQFGV